LGEKEVKSGGGGGKHGGGIGIRKEKAAGTSSQDTGDHVNAIGVQILSKQEKDKKLTLNRGVGERKRNGVAGR